MITLSFRENWYYWGKYFGFPTCCVEYFIANAGKISWDNIYPDGFPLDGTGYIPCPCCSKKSEQELIDIINSNRFCLTKFPEEGIFEEDEQRRQAMIESGELK